jgi:hypothetical protein
MTNPPTAPAAVAMHAWVDESVLVEDPTDPGTYVLAAVVASPHECDPIREGLRGLVAPKQARLHWKDEESGRRDLITASVAAMNLLAIVTVGTPVDKKKQERARRVCLERLLFELDQLDVDQVWLEARTQSLNARDQKMVASMRGSKAIPRGMRVDFERPLAEPMLWLPDVVAGTVTAVQRGRSHWFDQLSGSVELIDVKVR